MTGILNHELKVTGACFSSVSTFCSVSTFSVSTSCSVSISCFTWETLGPALETTPVSILSGRPETSFNGFHLNFRLPTTNRCTYEQLQKIITLLNYLKTRCWQWPCQMQYICSIQTLCSNQKQMGTVWEEREAHTNCHILQSPWHWASMLAAVPKTVALSLKAPATISIL